MMAKDRGFSLIELLIAMVIVGILAAIAFPSFQSSMQKSRRADAKGALMGFANAMERYFTVNNTYLGAAAGGGNTGAPTIYATQSPLDGNTKYYNLTIQAATATTYTLAATPIAGGPQASDSCGGLTVIQTGVRTPANCW
jgi:type IV pilus assembly protein PilE